MDLFLLSVTIFDKHNNESSLSLNTLPAPLMIRSNSDCLRWTTGEALHVRYNTNTMNPQATERGA